MKIITQSENGQESLADINANFAILKDTTGVNTGDQDLSSLASLAYVNARTPIVLYAVGSASAPVDTAFYYIGAPCGVSASGNPPDTYYMYRMYIPKTGIITAFYLTVSNFGTIGSGETGTITYYKNDASVADIFTGIATNAVGYANSSTGLSLAVTAGDYIYFQYKSPTWATNPTNLRWAIQVIIN